MHLIFWETLFLEKDMYLIDMYLIDCCYKKKKKKPWPKYFRGHDLVKEIKFSCFFFLLIFFFVAPPSGCDRLKKEEKAELGRRGKLIKTNKVKTRSSIKDIK